MSENRGVVVKVVVVITKVNKESDTIENEIFDDENENDDN